MFICALLYLVDVNELTQQTENFNTFVLWCISVTLVTGEALCRLSWASDQVIIALTVNDVQRKK